MQFKNLFGILILVLLAHGIVSAEESAGKLVFAVREPFLTEDGFRASTGRLEKGRDTKKWWDFYQFNIGIMNPDGSDYSKLTDNGISRMPKISIDRKRIAYISGIDEAKSLYIMFSDGTEKKRLIKKVFAIHDFWWSPNNDAVLAVVEIDRPKDRLENWVITVDGEIKRWRSERWTKGWLHWDVNGKKVKEPHRRLLEVLPEGTNWPEWSPDKNWIAFITDGYLALAEPDVVSMGRTWHLQRNEPPCDRVEKWSPDGKNILFITSGNICVAKVEKGQFSGYINLSLYSGRAPVWSPDSRQVAFIGSDSDRRRTSEIFIVNVETGNMQKITSTNYDFSNLDWK